MNIQSTDEFVKSLEVKDILERKPNYGHLTATKHEKDDDGSECIHSSLRSNHERQRLISFLSDKLRQFLKYDRSNKSLFNSIVESLIDSRLRLKTFGADTTILEEGELMDSLVIVLGGYVNVQCPVTQGIIYSYNKDEIIAMGSLGLQRVSLHSDIDMASRDLNHYFG